MDWIHGKLAELWDQCVNFYHVDPVIFLTMYIIKNVIFWWLMTYIVRRALRRQWDGLALLVALNAIIDVLPWLYVWIWGENQPWWYPYMVYAIGGWGFVGIYIDIRRKTKLHKKEAAQNAEVAQNAGASQSAEEAVGAVQAKSLEQK